MKIDRERNEVTLDGDELATAIDAYLMAHAVYLRGPRTIRFRFTDDGSGEVNWWLASDLEVKATVDPSGWIGLGDSGWIS